MTRAHFFQGLHIVEHPLATTTAWRVAKHPTPKRRRRWTVERYNKPSIWRVPGILYVHPDLMAKVLQSLGFREP